MYIYIYCCTAYDTFNTYTVAIAATQYYNIYYNALRSFRTYALRTNDEWFLWPNDLIIYKRAGVAVIKSRWSGVGNSVNQPNLYRYTGIRRLSAPPETRTTLIIRLKPAMDVLLFICSQYYSRLQLHFLQLVTYGYYVLAG